MLTRQKTLAQNIAIYGSLIAVLCVHGWFWGSWLRSARGNQDQLGKDVGRLKMDVERLKSESASVKKDLEDTQKALEDRRAELKELGTFLNPISRKPQDLKLILSIIEGLNIRILKTDFPPPEAPTTGGGYVTVNFTLELQGPYRAFKQLLSKIQQTTSMIIRISSFELKDSGRDNPSFEWRVVIKFETYFEA